MDPKDDPFPASLSVYGSSFDVMDLRASEMQDCYFDLDDGSFASPAPFNATSYVEPQDTLLGNYIWQESPCQAPAPTSPPKEHQIMSAAIVDPDFSQSSASSWLGSSPSSSQQLSKSSSNSSLSSMRVAYDATVEDRQTPTWDTVEDVSGAAIPNSFANNDDCSTFATFSVSNVPNSVQSEGFVYGSDAIEANPFCVLPTNVDHPAPRSSLLHQPHTQIGNMNGLGYEHQVEPSAISFESSPLSTNLANQELWRVNDLPPPPQIGAGFLEYLNQSAFEIHTPPASKTSHMYGKRIESPSGFYRAAGPYELDAIPTPPATPGPLPEKLFNLWSALSFSIDPLPQKSRAENQIPVKLILHSLPEGVTKLHLPRHTVSKPKLLTKPAPVRSPEMLELQATLVCTSAMQDPLKIGRAFMRDRCSCSIMNFKDKDIECSCGYTKGDGDVKPSNGYPVTICSTCLSREKKRAGRKKTRKPEDEEFWQHDDENRAIMFNTEEVVEWKDSSEANALAQGTMHVDLLMRIACYCRHHDEKMGFRVIFTLKNWEGICLAQEISTSINITDDHKTQPSSASAIRQRPTYPRNAPPSNAVFLVQANFAPPPQMAFGPIDPIFQACR